MASITDDPVPGSSSPTSVTGLLRLGEMWASLAIVSMWLAVLFDAIFGPNVVSTTAGGDSTVLPSAIGVALFACLATVPVAKYGYGRGGKHGR